jgi:NADPH-dependent glutamate synthase beta subunit-like oxidoreductase
MSESHPFAIDLVPGTSQGNHTGTWRTERPAYVRREAPCAHGCPAGEAVRDWLAPAQEREHELAWRRIMADNPLPAVMGRVCYHPCQTVCNRAQVDTAVGINSVERFLGDEAIRNRWTMPQSSAEAGARILIVGSGPAGLSAAYHLARLGHRVTIAEAAPRPGGMLRYGIPRYRLPDDVLDAEIDRILGESVELRLDHTVTDLGAELRTGGYAAGFLAVGAQLGHRVEIPADRAARMLDAVTLLHEVAEDERPMLGRRVVVYGGGDTAVDAARTAQRLGAADTVILYRRTRGRMPAHTEELEAAIAEGVHTRWLSTITHAAERSLTIERMELDESGVPRPTGEREELPADTLVLAVGQDPDLGLLGRLDGVERTHTGGVRVTDTMMTGQPGVFAGGDVTGAAGTATSAVGEGRRAALGIDAWLAHRELAGASPRRPVELAQLNTWYFTDAAHISRPRVEPAERRTDFREVVSGLDDDAAVHEAQRCMSCGSCLACDNCYGVCPDNAVIKLEPTRAYAYAIDLDHCKGCGLCAHECPSGAIAMFPERL